MPIEITMPRLSDTMEEGTLVKWRVKVGDEVASGQHLADVETDKATMELQSFDDGVVARLAVDEGATAPVGSLILVLAGKGESVEDAVANASKSPSTGASASADKSDTPDPAASEKTSSAETSGGRGGAGGAAKVSPLARRMAEEMGVDLSQVKGTGPDGRIIKRDILAAGNASESGATSTAASNASAPSQPATSGGGDTASGGGGKTIKLTNMRKTIAKRLVESKTTIPHFEVALSINADPLLELRQTVNQQLEPQGVKLSVNDFIVRGIALACLQHPEANSSWKGDVIEQHGTVNVGVAISLPAEKGGGLVVATIRDAQHKGLRQINQTVKQLAQKARTQGLTVEEMADSTITLSNLGMYGVESFNAIINPPNAAIIAVGAALKKPVVRNDELTIGHEMTATLAGDHRVIDGAAGAEFLQTLKGLLENPAALLV